MLNKVLLIGRLCNECELKETTNSKYLRNSIAINNKENTTFIPVIAWGKTAEFISKYFEKGNPIQIEGRLNNSTYTNKEDKKITTTDVVIEKVDFLPTSKSNKTDNNNTDKTIDDVSKQLDIIDEDLPF